MAGASALLADLRLGLRALRRQPGLAAAVILPVALAIATNTALFSVIDGLLFRPLPFDADRLVAIRWAQGSGVFLTDAARQQQRLVSEVGADPAILHGVHAGNAGPFSASPDLVAALGGLPTSGVTPGFFSLLGIQLALGRDLVATDVPDGQPLPAVISDDLWRVVFRADRAVVDSVVDLAGRSVHIVGVARPGIDYPRGSRLWVPADRGITTQLRNLGRLGPGVSIEQVRARYPGIEVIPLRESLQPAGVAGLVLMLSATALFVLVAWVQVGGLILARAVGRAQEIGLRLALGAGRGRLFRQFAAESAVLAMIALGLAWLATPWLTDFVVNQLPLAMTRGQHLDPDGRTFAFAAATSAIGMLLLSAVPVDLLRRASPVTLLRGSGAILRLRTERVRSGLLVAQIACTSLLLSLAGLALHSFVRVATFDVGFDAEGVLSFQLPGDAPAETPEARLAAAARRDARVVETVETLAHLPGVLAASAGMLPAYQGGLRNFVTQPDRPDQKGVLVFTNPVAPGYFATLGLRLVEGHTFDEPLYRNATDVAVVNRLFATMLGASGPVIDREVQVTRLKARIIGVVENILDTVPGRDIGPQIFVPDPRRANVVFVRVSGNPEAMRPVLTAALERLWGPFAPARLTRATDRYATVIAPWRSRSVLIGLIAALCLPLAAIGIIGATAYSVRARTREIAIRMALGADAGDVGRRVVVGAVVLAGVGIVIGLVAGVLAGRVVESQLFQVRPADTMTIASVAVGMVLLTCLSAAWPARRASRIAPAVALKEM